MRRFLRENSIGLVFGLLFVVVLVGQAYAGLAVFNSGQRASGLPDVAFWRYVTSAGFGVDVAENWQSEYLQFFLFIVLTVWLLQKGSPESKSLQKPGRETDEEQKLGPYADAKSPKWARVGGWRTAVFSNSLGLVMGLIFLGSWLAQSVAGLAAFNEEQLSERLDPVSWGQYVLGADFWNRTLQNWQSELLAVASMAILAVFLRQRGSSQSKPVGSAHEATGVEG
ncbi:hypothetical protein Aab01nite_33980 [Paractinoplanes abujensis]|uniref:Uncharacterized protein n=1 Tax=Paractinoplanes abujensis TaxID=882441 RepID=A0A7W7G4T8_9ACTN|nr:DUF6766 family protein [Actinoplanes abujensis]MBB4697703.1 hypothetical protein [Actinoplanes abujensis]GID19808.1 hypothetical protein Aab01nite_33980 [Actinoplanes abujensis]